MYDVKINYRLCQLFYKTGIQKSLCMLFGVYRYCITDI